MLHECYYCQQIFNSKEDLYEHVSTHTEPENSNRNKTND